MSRVCVFWPAAIRWDWLSEPLGCVWTPVKFRTTAVNGSYHCQERSDIHLTKSQVSAQKLKQSENFDETAVDDLNDIVKVGYEQ